MGRKEGEEGRKGKAGGRRSEGIQCVGRGGGDCAPVKPWAPQRASIQSDFFNLEYFISGEYVYCVFLCIIKKKKKEKG